MKRPLSILICILLLVGTLGLSPCAETDNLFTAHLQSAEGVLMTVFGGRVEYNSRFNQNGALSAIVDGNTTVAVDVYGALDWDTPRYVGVLLTLDDTYFGERVVIHSGYPNLNDTYRVYASDKLTNLYQESNRVADGLVVSGDAPGTVTIEKNIRYVAFFCTGYVGNQRIKEVQLFGTQKQEEESVENMGVVTRNKQLLLNDRPVALQGVNIPQFSWSSYGDGRTTYGQSDADTALNSVISGVWNQSKIVRLAIDPVLFVQGGVGSGAGQTVSRSAEEYRALIDKFVKALTDREIVVVIDCHAYAGVTDEVVAFWQVAAPHFDDNEYCIFGLLNEPISDWTTYYEGGTVTVPGVGERQSIGMTALLDTVRSLSDNVVAIGGIDWAFDLSGIASTGFSALAKQRASALGITEAEYTERYALNTEARLGRGIVLDTHIYSNKPLDWDTAIGQAVKEYPVLVGEYNPYFRNGLIASLDDRDRAFYNKIFSWITVNGLSSTSWSLGAEPFLCDNRGNMTALGTAVRQFIENGTWDTSCDRSLLYEHYKSARCIKTPTDRIRIATNNAFLSQAHYNNGAAMSGTDILRCITDGETDTHYDIYPMEDSYVGVEFTMDDVYAAGEIAVSSGINGYPDRYVIFASDNKTDLYSTANIIENASTDIVGTVRFKIDKQVKYVAFLAQGYVRIKNISVNGVHIGDINGDLHKTAADVAMLKKIILGTDGDSLRSGADVTRDQSVDVRDLVHLKNEMA